MGAKWRGAATAARRRRRRDLEEPGSGEIWREENRREQERSAGASGRGLRAATDRVGRGSYAEEVAAPRKKGVTYKF